MLTYEQQRDLRIIRRHGKGATSTLRRSNTIRKTSLTLAGAVLGGAASLTAQSSGLEGIVRRGTTFTLAGVAGSYTVAADAETNSNGQVVLSFAPVLAGPAASGAVLTFTVTYAEHSFPRMPGRQIVEDVKQVAEGEKVIHLAFVPGNPAPNPGESLAGLTLDGLPIKSWEPVGEGPMRYRVVTEAAA